MLSTLCVFAVMVCCREFRRDLVLPVLCALDCSMRLIDAVSCTWLMCGNRVRCAMCLAGIYARFYVNVRALFMHVVFFPDD